MPTGQLSSFDENSGAHGFTHVKNFNTPSEATDYLDRSFISGRGGAARLIVLFAHGIQSNVGAGIELDRSYTTGNIGDLAPLLRRIQYHLGARGKFYIAGCGIGANLLGTAFLSEVAGHVSDRVVVASETTIDQIRSLRPRGHPPGEIYIPIGGRRFLATPHHPSTKWIYNNTVLKYGWVEQGGRREGARENRCARPQCPGHETHFHQCTEPWNAHIEWANPRGRVEKGFKQFLTLRW